MSQHFQLKPSKDTIMCPSLQTERDFQAFSQQFSVHYEELHPPLSFGPATFLKNKLANEVWDQKIEL